MAPNFTYANPFELTFNTPLVTSLFAARISRKYRAEKLIGDKVLFGKYAGQTVKVDGEELLVMREEDIMAIVE